MATYNESSSGTLPFWNTQIENLLNQGQSLANQQRWQAPPQQTVAGFTPQQQQAFNLTGQNVGNYLPYLDQSNQLIGQSASNPMWGQAQSATQGAAGTNLIGAGAGLSGQAAGMFGQSGQFDPSQLQQYLNPYLSGVVGEIGRLGNEQFQNQVLPGLSSNFSSLGQYGSARQAALMADAAAKNQREVLGQQSGALNTGYTNAMGDYLNWSKQQQQAASGLAGLGNQQYQQALGQANLGMQAGAQFGDLAGAQSGAQLAAGNALGDLAQARQQMGLADVGALTAAGGLQQQQAQKQADLPFLNWQQQQAYPWQALNNWANLFKAGTPQSSTSWNTGFKKGGLARFADGGDFRSWDVINADTRGDQGARDEIRLKLLMQELEANPDDVNLLNEIQAMGVPLEEISVTPTNYSEMPRGLDLVNMSNTLALDDAESPAISPISASSDMLRSAFDERLRMLERARRMPELDPRKSPSTLAQMGEAMMRSAAQGPADWGSLIGRAGTSYFDRQDALEAENKQRALERLALEDKIAPELGAMGVGRGAADNFKVVTGQDGIPRLVNARDPSQQVEIGAGVNRQKIETEGDTYANRITEGGAYETVEEKQADFDRIKKAYIQSRIGGASPQEAIREVQGIGTPIPTPAEAAEQKEYGGVKGQIAGGYVKARDQGYSSLSAVQNMRENLKGYGTDRWTPITTEIAKWIEPFGISVAENLSGREAFESASQQLALIAGRTAEGTSALGQMTDSDREFIMRSLPTLGKTKEGNEKLLDIMEKIARLQITRANLAEEYIENNPRKVLDSGFYKLWDQYKRDNPMFPEAAKETKKADRKAASFESMPDASEFPGRRIKGPDGTFRSVNGQWVKE